MANNLNIDDSDFNCNKLTIFTSKSEINPYDLRKYVIEHWKRITTNLDNSTILFLCGVHGGPDGKLGKRADNAENLKKQVKIRQKDNWSSDKCSKINNIASVSQKI